MKHRCPGEYVCSGVANVAYGISDLVHGEDTKDMSFPLADHGPWLIIATNELRNNQYTSSWWCLVLNERVFAWVPEASLQSARYPWCPQP